MFSIIVAIDKNSGIGYNGDLPWKINKDMKYFKTITTKTKNPNKKNCVIMGKNTYLSIPNMYRPLRNRINIVLSKKINHLEDALLFSNINDIFDYINKNKKRIEHCYIIGGESIYNQFLESNYVSNILITEIGKEYNCDCFFGGEKNSDIFNNNKYLKNFNLVNNVTTDDIDLNNNESIIINFKKYTYNNIEEKQFLSLMQDIINNGIKRNDRTGVGTLSLFAKSLTYDLSNDTIPLLTTKFVPFRIIVEELLWMIKGSTDVSELQAKNIHIWDGNSSREFLDNRGLTHLPEGDIGVGYGANLRHFGAEYINCKTDYTNKGFDQLKYVMHLLKNDPTNRRILFSYWNPDKLHLAALPPCHILYQFYVDTEKNELSGCLYQRSSDYFLANNFNAIALALWIRIFCHLFGFKPGKITHFFADTHIYLNHIEQCKTQLSRIPTVFPKLKIIRNVENIEDFVFEDFKLINYFPQLKIQAPMAV